MRRSFEVGDLVVHRVVEMEQGFEDIRSFLPTLSAEVLEANVPWLAPTAYDRETGMAVLCFQSYIVSTPHHNVLVDTCVGNHKHFPNRPPWHRRTEQRWMQELVSLGLGVEDIDYVLCTHMHGDHVGWNTRLENGRWVPTFPNARYLFSEGELAYWSEVHERSPLGELTESVLPVIEAGQAELVGVDHVLDDYIRLLPTPGHTAHHVAVCAGKGADRAVFTGDLVHSPIQARYPELLMRGDVDQHLAVKTRRAFFERYCDTDTLFCTMHFPSPSVGHVKPWDGGFRLDYAT